MCPEGSAGIERTLAGYLYLAGKRPADMPLSTRTDYHPFLVAGVPIGGMTAGASQTKTTVQARLWGGQAGSAFDPNYQSARDTVGNVNREALAYGFWRGLRGGQLRGVDRRSQRRPAA